jgi:hypothetical protein
MPKKLHCPTLLSPLLVLSVLVTLDTVNATHVLNAALPALKIIPAAKLSFVLIVSPASLSMVAYVPLPHPALCVNLVTRIIVNVPICLILYLQTHNKKLTTILILTTAAAMHHNLDQMALKTNKIAMTNTMKKRTKKVNQKMK